MQENKLEISLLCSKNDYGSILNNKVFKVVLSCLILLLISTYANSQLLTYPAPTGAPVSNAYVVKANGQNVAVYNGVAEGGDTYYFCYMDFDNLIVSMEISSPGIAFSNPKIRPSSSGIQPGVSGGKATFSITEHGQYAFLPSASNYANTLLIFANHLEVAPPKAGDPGVVYFGPGVHQVDNLNLNSNQTLYIHGSAFLKGGLNLNGKSNIKIRGRGIIDGMDWGKWTGPTGYKYALIKLENTSNVSIEGIVIRGSWAASIHVYSSSQTMIDNVKVCNSRFANDDGIAPINTKSMTIKNTFIRTDDDCIPLKGYNSNRADIDGILVEGCVLWCDRARAILIGAETMVNNMKNITIRNCEVIHYEARLVYIQASEEGTIGPNVLIENINAQSDNNPSASYKELIRITTEVVSWAQLPIPGYVDGITVRNINVTGTQNGGKFIWVEGYDAKYTTKNVSIECIKYNGTPLLSNSSGVYVGSFTNNINISACAITGASVRETSDAQLQLFPNPAKDLLTIAGIISENSVYEITSMEGRSVQKGIVISQSISIEDLDAGSYIIQIKADGGEIVRRFVKAQGF